MRGQHYADPQTMGFSIGGFDLLDPTSPFRAELRGIQGVMRDTGRFTSAALRLDPLFGQKAAAFNDKIVAAILKPGDMLIDEVERVHKAAKKWCQDHRREVTFVAVLVGSIYLGPLVYGMWAAMGAGPTMATLLTAASEQVLIKQASNAGVDPNYLKAAQIGFAVGNAQAISQAKAAANAGTMTQAQSAALAKTVPDSLTTNIAGFQVPVSPSAWAAGAKAAGKMIARDVLAKKLDPIKANEAMGYLDALAKAADAWESGSITKAATSALGAVKTLTTAEAQREKQKQMADKVKLTLPRPLPVKVQVPVNAKTIPLSPVASMVRVAGAPITTSGATSPLPVPSVSTAGPVAEPDGLPSWLIPAGIAIAAIFFFSRSK